MFHSYITHRQARAYSNSLIENGHLSYDSEKKRYLITPEGLTYLDALKHMSDLLPAVRPRILERASPLDASGTGLGLALLIAGYGVSTMMVAF